MLTSLALTASQSDESFAEQIADSREAQFTLIMYNWQRNAIYQLNLYRVAGISILPMGLATDAVEVLVATDEELAVIHCGGGVSLFRDFVLGDDVELWPGLITVMSPRLERKYARPLAEMRDALWSPGRRSIHRRSPDLASKQLATPLSATTRKYLPIEIGEGT